MPDGTALDLLPQLKQSHPSVPLILLTGNGSIPLAVQAIKEGAEQFLTKPVEMAAIAVLLERALKNQRNLQKQLAGKAREKRESVDPFMGTSPAISRGSGTGGKSLPEPLSCPDRGRNRFWQGRVGQMGA